MLLQEVLQDYCYYVATGGGVTFGGGESLLYAEAIRAFGENLPDGGDGIRGQHPGIGREQQIGQVDRRDGPKNQQEQESRMLSPIAGGQGQSVPQAEQHVQSHQEPAQKAAAQIEQVQQRRHRLKQGIIGQQRGS